MAAEGSRKELIEAINTLAYNVRSLHEASSGIHDWLAQVHSRCGELDERMESLERAIDDLAHEMQFE